MRFFLFLPWTCSATYVQNHLWSTEVLNTVVSNIPSFNVIISFNKPVLKYNKYIQTRGVSIERLWETFTEELRADGGQRGAWKAEQKRTFGCIWSCCRFPLFSVWLLVLKQLWWARNTQTHDRSAYTPTSECERCASGCSSVVLPPSAAALSVLGHLLFAGSVGVVVSVCVRWCVWCRRWTPCPWRSAGHSRCLRGWRGSGRCPARSCSAEGGGGLRSRPGTPPESETHTQTHTDFNWTHQIF